MGIYTRTFLFDRTWVLVWGLSPVSLSKLCSTSQCSSYCFWNWKSSWEKLSQVLIVVPLSSHIVIFHNIDLSALINILKDVEVTTFKIYLRWNFFLRNWPFCFIFSYALLSRRSLMLTWFFFFCREVILFIWNIYLRSIIFLVLALESHFLNLALDLDSFSKCIILSLLLVKKFYYFVD